MPDGLDPDDEHDKQRDGHEDSPRSDDHIAADALSPTLLDVLT
jgi:hypothetical protein